MFIHLVILALNPEVTEETAADLVSQLNDLEKQIRLPNLTVRAGQEKDQRSGAIKIGVPDPPTIGHHFGLFVVAAER